MLHEVYALGQYNIYMFSGGRKRNRNAPHIGRHSRVARHSPTSRRVAPRQRVRACVRSTVVDRFERRGKDASRRRVRGVDGDDCTRVEIEWESQRCTLGIAFRAHSTNHASGKGSIVRVALSFKS